MPSEFSGIERRLDELNERLARLQPLQSKPRAEFDADPYLRDIAERVGKSRVAVTNSLRLLSLEPEYREMISRGTLTPGHARALLGVQEGTARRRLANDIVKQGLSVRQAEVRAQGQRPKSGSLRSQCPTLFCS